MIKGQDNKKGSMRTCWEAVEKGKKKKKKEREKENQVF